MLLSSIRKEIKIFLSDKTNVIVQLFMPLILIIFVTYAIGDTYNPDEDTNIKVPVLIQSSAKQENVDLVKKFMVKNGTFKLEEAQSKEKILDDLEKGRRVFGLILENNKINVLVDPSSSTSQGLADSFQGVFAQFYYGYKGFVVQSPPKPDYQLERILIGNKKEYPSTPAQFVPSYAIMFMFFLIMNMGKVLIQEDESGTIKRLIAAPISTTTLLISKLTPYFLLGILQAILFFGVGGAIVDLPVTEHILALAIISVAVVLVVITAGLFIASIAKTEKQLNGYGTLFALLGAGIGGLMVPLYIMPDTMQTVAQIVPQNWALVAFQDVFVRNKPIVDILPKIGVLIGFAVAFFSLGLVTFKKRFF